MAIWSAEIKELEAKFLIRLRVKLRRTRRVGLIGFAELTASRRFGSSVLAPLKSPELALGFIPFN
jgi:hypothetical protein